MNDRISFINDIPMSLTVVYASRELFVRDFMDLKPGVVLELDKLAGEPFDLYMNGTIIAKGEIVIVNERYGIRLTDILVK